MKKTDNSIIYHFTKIAQDRFQIYDFEKKEGSLVNTKELGDFLANLRGGKAMDSSFYRRLISLPSCHTIGVTASALGIHKEAKYQGVEPWKLVKENGQEFFISVKTGLEDDEEDENKIKATASLHKTTHHYKVALKTGDSIRRHSAFRILSNELGLSQQDFFMNPADMDGMLIVDIDSQDNPHQVIEKLINILDSKDMKMNALDMECNHDYCDCGQECVGPIVPDADEDDFILVAPEQKPIIAKNLETLKKNAEGLKHYKIYAYDKVIYDFDEELRRAQEEANKALPSEKTFFDKNDELETEAADNTVYYNEQTGEYKSTKDLGMENNTTGVEPESVTMQDGTYTKKTVAESLSNIFKEASSVEATQEVKDLMRIAYYSNVFDKIAFLGPEKFIFADKDNMYLLDDTAATCSAIEKLENCVEATPKEEQEDELVSMVEEEVK